MDVHVLLEAGVGGHGQVVGNRYAGLLQRVRRDAGVERVVLRAGALVGDRDARVALDRLLGAAAGHRRHGMRDRAGEPAVDHLDLRRSVRAHEPLRVAARAGAPASDVARGRDHRVRQITGGALGLRVVAVVVLAALARLVAAALLGLVIPDGALGVDRHRAGLAVGDALERTEPVGGDQVVALEHLRVDRVVDEVGQRLRPARVRHVVEAHDGHVVVAVVVREAGRGPVVGRPGAGHVAVKVGQLAHGAADGRRDEVVRGALDSLRQALGVVVVEAHVEEVLEGPHAPGRARVVRRRVVVGGHHRQVLARDAAVALLEQLRGAAVEKVLREVEVLLDDRGARAVGALDDDRADLQPRLEAVRAAEVVRVDARVEAVRVDEAAG